MLASLQLEQARQAATVFETGIGQHNSLLLIGPSGVGKRTIIGEVARITDSTLVECYCPYLNVKVLSEELTTLPSDEILLSLVGLEHTDSATISTLVDLVVDRTLDSTRLPSGTRIIGALSTPVGRVQDNDRINLIQGIFDIHQHVRVPGTYEDYEIVSESILRDAGIDATLSREAVEEIRKHVGPPGYLTSLREWLLAAHFSTPSGLIQKDAIVRSIDNHVSNVLASCIYRGERITVRDYSEWADQFMEDCRHLAAHIARRIALHYFIDEQAYWNALRQLMDQINLARFSSISLCCWQGMGHSAPDVTNKLKNLAHWTIESEIDVRPEHISLPSFAGRKMPRILLLDDFVGSGNTIASLFRPGGEMELLHEHYPDAQIDIGVLGGFISGLRRIRGLAKECPAEVNLIAPSQYILDDRDRCFTSTSLIVSDEAEQELLKSFITSKATTAMGMNIRTAARYAFGYEGIAGLIVLPNTVPNHSLSIIWFDKEGCSWTPLFAAAENLDAAGLLDDD